MRGERREEIDGGGNKRMKEDASWQEKSPFSQHPKDMPARTIYGAVKQLC